MSDRRRNLDQYCIKQSTLSPRGKPYINNFAVKNWFPFINTKS